MMLIDSLWLGVSLLSLMIWVGLLVWRGQFWRSDQQLIPSPASSLKTWPPVCAVVPARNEASLLPITLQSLLTQTYPGPFRVVLVDDQSTDGTAAVAQAIATEVNQVQRLQVITTDPLPSGWTGKLWALHQGIQKVLSKEASTWPYYVFLTDADICHDPDNLRTLVTKAQQDDLDLASLMVQLRCQSGWEQFLIPAFVFFFQKLYPFAWVNDPLRPTAAAAGGCILVRRQALERAGGLEAVREALIDDCSLAAAIKASAVEHAGTGQIWLGLTTTTHSLRAYESLESIWTMVARTAYTQLHHSPWLLFGTVIGMGLVYLVAPVSAVLGWMLGKGLIAITGTLTWLLMAIAYYPTVRLYRISPLWAGTLPAIALLYNLMTLDSARRHWQGKGGAWKGRVYPAR